MVLYKKKYRIETNRLTSHTYDEGMYFVTICTKKKMQWFGEVRDGKMVLSEAGEIVADEWRKSPSLRSNVQLDDWCIMPNHIHGILRIRNVETSRGDVSLSKSTDVLGSETCAPHVSTKKLVLQPKGLGSIINQFKGAVTKRCRTAGFPEFQWQPRYHDHIIRSEKELSAIRQYIASNPNTWDKETIPWHADGASWSL